MRTLDVMLALLRYEILGAELPEDFSSTLSVEKLESLYRLSLRHDIAHLVGDALMKSGVMSDRDDVESRFLKARELAIYRYTQMQHEYKRILSALEGGGVPHVPLKGAIVRQYYPKPWMRTSCDIDILVKPSDLQRAKRLLLDSLGYSYKGEYTEHDVSLVSPSGVCLELHYELLDGDDECGAEVLSSVWEHTVLADGLSFCYLMTDEAFYFYHVAHMARHFRHGGCGIRSVLDLWLLNNGAEFDREKRQKLLLQGGLLSFASAMERLSDVWFADKDGDELILELSEYIRIGGVYGNADNRVRVQSTKAGGRFKYLMSRIFISNKALKKKYPILERRPYLIPFYHVGRWFKPLFSSKSKESALRDVKRTKVSQLDRERTAELLERLGL
jgi:hypothetical protein